jgi:hypothetical protein
MPVYWQYQISMGDNQTICEEERGQKKDAECVFFYLGDLRNG